MAIKVIYGDKNIGLVNESCLDKLIKSGRIAAYCRSNDEWYGVRNEPNGHEVDYNKPEKNGA